MLIHTRGTLICTTRTGQVVTRRTDNAYKAVIVGRNVDGRLVVCYEAWNPNKAASVLKSRLAGQYISRRFVGVYDLELVTSDEPLIVLDMGK